MKDQRNNNNELHELRRDSDYSELSNSRTIVESEQKAEYRELADKLGLYSKIVEQSTNMICISSTEGIIEYVNPKTLEVTGYAEAELLGANTRIFGSGLKPREEYAELWKTIKGGHVWRGELYNKKSNGECYWEFVTISPIFDNHGKITHFFAIKVDVTEQKKVHQDLSLAKERAEESEILLRTFIENIPFEIWACDVNKVGILENKMHVEHFGTIIGQSLKGNDTICRNHVQLGENNWERMMHGEVINEEWECEVNQRQNIFQQIAFPIYKKERIIGIAGLNIDVTDRKLAENALINSEVQLRRFASHLQNIRDEERNALAREIHDDLGQILVALKIDAGLLKQKLLKNDTFNCPADILEKFDNITGLIDNTIETSRRIMNGLRPQLLELLGLEMSIKQYLCELENRHQLKCEFVSSTSKLEINQRHTLILFRIFQEAMANIFKHAEATLVKVELGKLKTKLFMEIVDNGIGFNTEHSGRPDSYGMISMKERAFLLKGKLTITSKVGEGTRVRVEIPYLG